MGHGARDALSGRGRGTGVISAGLQHESPEAESSAAGRQALNDRAESTPWRRPVTASCVAARQRWHRGQ